jgi:lysophospholipase L1-like esterase
MRPFWKSDTIFNETLLLYSVNGQPASGTLLFEPEKIVSVESYNLKRSFTNGRDYVSNGNIIVRTGNSGMPFRTDTSFDRKNNLAWYDVQSQWVVVNYIHKDKWQGPVPEYKGDRMPGTMHKLLSKQPLKIAAYGMSITRGMDVSGYDTIAPYMPTYLDLFATQLRKIYSNNRIKLYNAGLPGSTVSWGEKYVDDYINPLKPDLVILDFGMNDFWSTTPDQFEKSILEIINKIKIKNPQTEFILLSNLKYDPDYILGSDKNKIIYDANMDGYNIRLKGLEAKGIVNLDMTTLSEFIYSHKKAKDCIANPMHPNDYMARWYAQGLVQLLLY